MITHTELGDDESLAREILVIARSIAPCIAAFPTGSEQRSDAVAILKRVYRDTVSRGPRFVRGQSVGPARVDYTDIGSMFEGTPTRALRALCSAATSGGAGLGSFPKDRPIGKIWPEAY